MPDDIAARQDSIAQRKSVLDPVDRVSEMCFGLYMALTFVGAVSSTTAGPDAAQTMLRAALGCNLAWGLVDAIMFLVRTLANRGMRLKLALAVKQAPDPAGGIGAVRDALPATVNTLVTDTDLEPLRSRLAAATTLPNAPRLHFGDFMGALRIFFIVVLSTFPVALPFVLLDDLRLALLVSRLLTLAMLFGGGMALGHFAGFSAWRAGLAMTALGIALTIAIVALGG